MIRNKKILVTGATGQVARPIAEMLAKDNEVWCAARFSEPHLKTEVEAVGIKTYTWSLGSDDFRGLPKDFNYVIHSACNIFPVANDYDGSIVTNAEGTGLLMSHCRTAEAFLYISSLAVYQTPDDTRNLCDERKAPLGSHPVYAPSYSTGKISTEAVVRTLARVFSMPSIIARLGMAYGTAAHGGVPSITFKKMLAGEPIRMPSKDYYYSPIHEDDVLAHVEPFLKAASVPAAIVNWGGDELVRERDMYDYIGQVTGVKPNIVIDDVGGYAGGGVGDPAGRRKITGPTKVSWKDGYLDSLRKNFPNHKFAV
jgi:nucleoside-diphosphate-sugar epimerase